MFKKKIKKNHKGKKSVAPKILIISGSIIVFLVALYLVYYYFLGGVSLKGYSKAGFNLQGYNAQGYDKYGFNATGWDKDGYNREGYSKNPTAGERVKRIAEKYHASHTYSLTSFFVCSDMANDVWNMIETEGISAMICAGNVNSNIFEQSDWDYVFGNMNHAWVLAETDPPYYVAVETTGGFLVSQQENYLYYYGGVCFDTSGNFKKFLNLRDSYFLVCGEAKQLRDYWNNNIAGKMIYTLEVSEYEGRMNAKIQECNGIITELNSLLK